MEAHPDGIVTPAKDVPCANPWPPMAPHPVRTFTLASDLRRRLRWVNADGSELQRDSTDGLAFIRNADAREECAAAAAELPIVSQLGVISRPVSALHPMNASSRTFLHPSLFSSPLKFTASSNAFTNVGTSER
jgi:hypothetical protein